MIGSKLDALVVGIGTGGTATGTGETLKKELPDLKIFAVEPAESPVFSGGRPGPHKIQGIGAGFIPGVVVDGLARAKAGGYTLIDEVIQCSDDDAFETARRGVVVIGINVSAAAIDEVEDAAVAAPIHAVRADEVQTGWGRTGDKWFGIEHWNVEPDIITSAKGMANGVPIGMTTATPEVADSYPGLTFSTFGGNPVSMAAALAVIKLIEDGGIDTRPWITHHASFDEMIAVFPAWLQQESAVIKAVMHVT